MSLKQLLVAFAISCSLGGLSFANSDDSSSKYELRKFLRSYLDNDSQNIDKTTRFASAKVSFHGKLREVLVYISGRTWCGSGGCPLLVLRPKGSSYAVVGRVTVVRLPIRVLRHSSNGLPDITVWVQGGGIQPGYEAALTFDGVNYPDNPTVPPAHRVKAGTSGIVLLPRQVRGQLLYATPAHPSNSCR